MPNYEISEAGRQLLQAQAALGAAQPQPSTFPSENYPATPTRYPGPMPAAYQPSAQPFAYNSWEAMTNIEKFDKLREDINSYKGSVDHLADDIYRLKEVIERHRHSANDGSVMVQYNRDRF